MYRQIQGAVLCGGKSSRMGCNKAAILQGTKPQAVHLAELLGRLTGREPLLLGDPGLSTHFEVIPDPLPGGGPLPPIVQALRRGAPLFILAVDFFAFDEAAARWLLNQTILTSSTGAIRAKLDSRPFGEPLSAVYYAGSLPFLERGLEKGCGPLRSLPDHMVTECLVPKQLEYAFQDADTPDEFERLFGHRPFVT